MELDDFVKFSKVDRDPEAPAVLLELQGRPELTLTLPYPMYFTFTRESCSADVQNTSITLLWDVFSVLTEPKIVILHQTEKGFEKIDLPVDERYNLIRKQRKYIGCRDLTEVPPEGTEILDTLPGIFHDSLKPGENYVLLWPGGEIKWWDWGDIQYGERMGLDDVNHCPRPRIIIPASNPVHFIVREEPVSWPDREEYAKTLSIDSLNREEESWRQELEWEKTVPQGPGPMVSESERFSGAPIISITLQGPAEYSLGKKDNVTILLTYHDCTTDTNRPIILQKNFNTNLMEHRNFSLLHHSPRGLELMQRETGIGFPMKYLEENWGPKDLLATNEAVFLAPGESSTEHTALWDYEFEDGGFEVGEKYTFRYDGGEIPWWNWGTKEEWENRKIPIHYEGYRTIVDEPPSQTPKIILPASNDYEFIVVE